MRLAGEDHPFSGYIAEFYGAHFSLDKQIFFVEELLSQPLDRIGAVKILSKFAQYARDLCRGLEFLHSNQLVHRDLKLDNCGLSFSGRIKIFDLGSVTSENKEVKGTILTRAPELFRSGAALGRDKSRKKSVEATTAADVWAMGATLFALRTGTYPFVHSNEIEERRRINEDLKRALGSEIPATLKEEARNVADQRKAAIDSLISERILDSNAENDLMRRIDSELRGTSGRILKSMLCFNPSERKSAGDYAKDWNSVLESQDAGSLNRLQDMNDAKIGDIHLYAIRVQNKEVAITDRQRQRLIEEIDNEFAKNGEKAEIIADIKRCLAA